MEMDHHGLKSFKSEHSAPAAARTAESLPKNQLLKSSVCNNRVSGTPPPYTHYTSLIPCRHILKNVCGPLFSATQNAWEFIL